MGSPNSYAGSGLSLPEGEPKGMETLDLGVFWFNSLPQTNREVEEK